MRNADFEISSVAEVLRMFKEDRSFKDFRSFPVGTRAFGPVHRDLFGIWFRGQAEFGWHLVPSVFRPGAPENEELAAWLFMLRAAEYRKDCHTQFDWLCLMRHYELPTRLLDWSENVLVALYMACSEQVKEKEGALWILNVQRLNSQTRLGGDTAAVAVPSLCEVLFRAAMAIEATYPLFGDHIASLADRGIIHDMFRYRDLMKKFEEDPKRLAEELSSPVAVYPYRIGSRMIVQQSVFTLHGGREPNSRLEGVPSDILPPPVHLEELNDGLPSEQQFLRLGKITNKNAILEELDQLGMTASTLFPELEYSSRDLKRKLRSREIT